MDAPLVTLVEAPEYDEFVVDDASAVETDPGQLDEGEDKDPYTSEEGGCANAPTDIDNTVLDCAASDDFLPCADFTMLLQQLLMTHVFLMLMFMMLFLLQWLPMMPFL